MHSNVAMLVRFGGKDKLSEGKNGVGSPYPLAHQKTPFFNNICCHVGIRPLTMLLHVRFPTFVKLSFFQNFTSKGIFLKSIKLCAMRLLIASNVPDC